jgi:hypothetical protein
LSNRTRFTSRGLVILAAVAVLMLAGTAMAHALASRGYALRPETSWSASTRALVRELAILRRPQRKSDRNRALLSGPSLSNANPVMSLMRRATSASGQHVYLVPVQLTHGHLVGHAGLAVFGIGGGGCCITAPEIESGKTFSSSGPPNRVLFVVPDGVAQVKLTLKTGPDPQNPPRVSAKVHDNVVVFNTPFAVETVSGDPMSWYGSTGHLIKRPHP